MASTTEPGGFPLITLLRRHTAVVVVCVVALVVVVTWVVSTLSVAPPEPGIRNVADLPEKKQIPERKRAFFEFLRPVVRAENDRIRAQRTRLKAVVEAVESGESISGDTRAWLGEMAKRYRVDAEEVPDRARALMNRVDIIPPALALAQAALESAWGQSRFAREANNLFGEWCFEPGCGVIPKQRPTGRTYEVEAFDGVGGSVRSYMHNLNSHPAYAELRRIRARDRARGKAPDGYAMAAGLERYAAIGQEYVEHIRGVIRRNDLQPQSSG